MGKGMMVAMAMATMKGKVTAMATATVVTLALVGGSYHGSNGLTIRYAILLWYADVINVRSNNDDECAPTKSTINGGNLDRGGCQF
jgi:hypothetical protein